MTVLVFMAPYKILHPTDLSRDYVDIAKKAAEYAKSLGAELCLMHVMESIQTYGYPVVTDLSVEHKAWVEERLHELGDALGIDEPHQIIRSGSVKEKVLQFAGERGMNLIILGYHPQHGWQRFILGSVADSIQQDADRDVLIIH